MVGQRQCEEKTLCIFLKLAYSTPKFREPHNMRAILSKSREYFWNFLENPIFLPFLYWFVYSTAKYIDLSSHLLSKQPSCDVEHVSF